MPSAEEGNIPPAEDYVVRPPMFSPDSTLALRTASSPMIAPREDVPLERRRSHPGRNMLEIDDEFLNKPFQKPTGQSSAILCRFCKAPLDLKGNFCEQCGAPLRDAMPPGTPAE